MQDQPVIDPNKKPPHGRNMAPPCPPKTHGSNRQRQGRSELPEGWRWVKLGDVCEVIGGSQPPKSTFKYEPKPGYIRLVQIQDFRKHDSAVYIPKELARRTFEKDDVMIGRYGPPVFQILRGLSGAYNVALMKASPRDSITKDYLYFLLQEPSIQLAVIGQSRRAAGQSGVRRTFLESLLVPLPPLDEQKRIVAVLSDRLAAVEQARLAAEAQLEAATALPAAYLRQVFDSPEAQKWEKKALGDVAKVGSGITLGRKFKEDVATRRVPYLRVANVKDGYLDLSDITATEATESEISKCLLQYGDILLTEGGDPDKLGRGTYWQNELMECIHQNHIFRVRFDLSDYVPSFISAQIGSSYGKSYFLSHAKQTTGIATINQRVLKGFPLASPPVEIQKEIVSRLENELRKAEEIKKLLQDQLDTINALPAALLRQAFNGEL